MMETKRCPSCDGLGRIPADPELTAADLRAEVMRELTDSAGRRAFDERVARKQAEQAGRER